VVLADEMSGSEVAAADEGEGEGGESFTSKGKGRAV
jgi:hypothetical protein